MKTFMGGCAVALLALASGSARAQGGVSVTLAPNAEVRVRTLEQPSRAIRGRALELTADTLFLSRSGVMTRYPVSALRSLEVRSGHDRRRGMLIGGAATGGIALVFGGIDASRGKISTGEWMGTIVSNTIIGGLFGYMLAPRGWAQVPLGRR